MPDSPASYVDYQAFPQLDIGNHSGSILQLLATPDGRTLVSVGDTTLRVWDPEETTPDANRLKRVLLGRVNGLTNDEGIDGNTWVSTVSRDGRWLVALKFWRHDSLQDKEAALGHDEGLVTVVEVFEIGTGNLHTRFVYPRPVLDIDFSHDGHWVAVATNVMKGSQRRVEVSVLATSDLLRPGVRPLPAALSRLELGSARSVDFVPAALCFAPAVDPSFPRPADPSALLVVAIGEHDDEDDGNRQLAWLRLSADGGLTLLHQTDFDHPIEAGSLAVSATLVAVADAALAGSKKRGCFHWLRHNGDGPGARGVIDTEAPPASIAVSPSGHRLAVGLSEDDEGSGAQTVQVDVYDIGPLGPPALRSTYLGHDGAVTGLCFISDTTVASAGGDNQAIHIWRPTCRVVETNIIIRGAGRVAIAPGITADERVLFGTVPIRKLPPRFPVRQQSFDLRRRVLSSTAASDLRVKNRSRKWFVGYEENPLIPLWFVGEHDPGFDPTESMLEPDLSLFVGADDSWVLWTRSGYYDAGGGDDAARRIGYRVNRGLDQEGLVIPSDRFKGFYRPDIVDAVVRHGSEERALAKGVKIPPVNVTHILPPIAELAQGGITNKASSVALAFTVESPCSAVLPTRFSLLRNGRVVWIDPKPAQQAYQRCEVPSLPLLPGVNRFAFHAENQLAKSVPVLFEVEGAVRSADDAVQADAPGRLYLLAVGVAEFADPNASKLDFPQRDAQAVFDAFGHGLTGGQGSSQVTGALPSNNRAFESVDAKLLVNAEATKSAILAELERMCDSIRERHAQVGAERDVLFVFLASHGVRVFEEESSVPNLFFQNYDMVLTAEDVDATGLSMLDLGDRITSVPAEVVLVIDACHAALAGRGTMAGLGAEELARRVHAIHERGMYLVSACKADEEASEDTNSRQGLLTASILRAVSQVRPGAGAGGLDVLMAELVAGVQRLVPELGAALGGEVQTPVCRIYGDLMPLTILRTGDARS